MERILAVLVTEPESGSCDKYEISSLLTLEEGELVAENTTITKNGDNFVAKGSVWATGQVLDNNNFVYFLVNNIIRKNTKYEVVEAVPLLKELFSKYSECLKGSNIPVKTLDCVWGEEYTLSLVTTENIFYVSESGNLIMLDTKTHDLVSDNYFAEEGFHSACENIKAGSEKLLFAEENVKEYLK